jgi:hypothetical protein
LAMMEHCHLPKHVELYLVTCFAHHNLVSTHVMIVLIFHKNQNIISSKVISE